MSAMCLNDRFDKSGCEDRIAGVAYVDMNSDSMQFKYKVCPTTFGCWHPFVHCAFLHDLVRQGRFLYCSDATSSKIIVA